MPVPTRKNPDGSITTGFIPREWYKDQMPGEWLDGAITVRPGDPPYPEMEELLEQTTNPFAVAEVTKSAETVLPEEM